MKKVFGVLIIFWGAFLAMGAIGTLIMQEYTGGLFTLVLAALSLWWGFSLFQSPNSDSLLTYKQAIYSAIEDNVLDEYEEKNLEALRVRLKISKKKAEKMYSEIASQIITKKIELALEDGMLSPEEERGIQTLASNLNAHLDGDTRHYLKKFKLYWKIENDGLQPIETNLTLPKTEECYFVKSKVSWCEYRVVTKSYNYGGVSMRVKLAKGVYLRGGKIAAQKVSEDILKEIDNGTLFLTNKRIIFMGSKGNKNIRLNKILDFNGYKNGVQIQKDTGKSPFLEFDQKLDVFVITLNHLLKDLFNN